MSGTYPNTPVPTAIEITSVSPTFVSITHSLKRQVRQRGGGVQRWRINLTYSDTMSRSVAAPLEAFILKQAGQYETFTYTPPTAIMSALGSYAGSVTVNGNHSAGDSTINVSGSSGTLSAGSWATFAGHTKMYRIVADSTTTLNIFPALQVDVATGAVVTYSSPSFKVAMAGDQFDVGIAVPLLYSFSVSMVEVY